jgi:hypothetical protein
MLRIITGAEDTLITRVRAEYSELPGLRLTLWQAQRLYGITYDEARRILDRLVRTGYLRMTQDGAYVRG